MSNIVNRISLIADNEGIKITSLERVLGASKGVISRAIKNNTDIQSKWIVSLVENYPHYNTLWILTGRGEMLLNETGLTNTFKNNNTTRNEGGKHPLSSLEEKKGGNLQLNNDDDDLGLGEPKESISFYQKLVDKQADWIDQMQDQADVLIKMVSQRDVIIRKQHKELEKFKNKDTGTSVG